MSGKAFLEDMGGLRAAKKAAVQFDSYSLLEVEDTETGEKGVGVCVSAELGGLDDSMEYKHSAAFVEGDCLIWNKESKKPVFLFKGFNFKNLSSFSTVLLFLNNGIALCSVEKNQALENLK